MTEESVTGPEIEDGYPEQGPESTDGYPDQESVADDGHPESQPDPQEEAALGGNWEQRYKDLQSHQTKVNQELAQTRQNLDLINNAFHGYGGIQEAARMLQTVTSNSDIRSILEQQVSQKTAPDPIALARAVGLDPADEDQINALNVVQKVTESVVKPLIEKTQIYEDRLREIESGMTYERGQALAKQMDQKYPNWREYEGSMARLISNLSPEVQRNPTLETIEALYGAAVLQSGKLEEIGETVYRKKVESMKSKSIDKPKTGGPQTSKPAGTWDEAFKLAMKQHGVEGLFR